MATWLVWLTIGVPWLGAFVVWRLGDERSRAQHGAAAAFAVMGGVAALLLLPFVGETAVSRIPVGGIFGDFTLVADGLGVFLAVIATVIGSLAVIFSGAYMHGATQLGRYYALVLLFIGAMAGLVLAGGFLLLFLFWEITAFCSYALISFHNDDPKAVSGGVKALIMTQVGGVGLLLLALLAYSYLGSYEISDFLAQAHTLPAVVLSLAAFGALAAAAAKSAQVPFHTWLPDAMEAPSPVSALIHAATMVNAGVYLLARLYPAFAAVPGWTTAVITVGLLSALLAAVMALAATDLKRALAYSTISQLGYMVYAVGVGGVFASQFHLLSHAVFKALLFLSAGAVIHAIGTRDMRQMGGLGLTMPFARAVFLAGALALAGLPLANGFFSKELILEEGLHHGPLWAYVGVLLGAGLTALYTLRMVAMVFYGETAVTKRVHDAPLLMRIPLGLLALGSLTTWLLAGPFARLLAATLPYHGLKEMMTVEMAVEIITAPATGLALLVIALGLAVWPLRHRLHRWRQPLRPLVDLTVNGLGFEDINRQIIQGTKGAAAVFSRVQTGQLNWNVAAIVGALALVLVILMWGA
ncbi:MAG: NADH-quinone oxidoreductase subunit L [Anaerolinea sp.]|nr:NADH-quinone oxidoreductase subunit L [Anaerolinea sp.]